MKERATHLVIEIDVQLNLYIKQLKEHVIPLQRTRRTSLPVKVWEDASMRSVSDRRHAGEANDADRTLTLMIIARYR